MNNLNIAQAAQLPIEKLRPFEGHPFQVKDDAEMGQLLYSIITQGLLTPISVRPVENNEYEVISGHRRLYACKKAGIETVPALIYALDRDAAAIALVDSNLHREKILPQELQRRPDSGNHSETAVRLSEKASAQQRGAVIMELDMDYAALKLMEILFERGLINYQTLQAAKEMVKDAPHISQAA